MVSSWWHQCYGILPVISTSCRFPLLCFDTIHLCSSTLDLDYNAMYIYTGGKAELQFSRATVQSSSTSVITLQILMQKELRQIQCNCLLNNLTKILAFHSAAVPFQLIVAFLGQNHGNPIIKQGPT